MNVLFELNKYLSLTFALILCIRQTTDTWCSCFVHFFLLLFWSSTREYTLWRIIIRWSLFKMNVEPCDGRKKREVEGKATKWKDIYVKSASHINHIANLYYMSLNFFFLFFVPVGRFLLGTWTKNIRKIHTLRTENINNGINIMSVYNIALLLLKYSIFPLFERTWNTSNRIYMLGTILYHFGFNVRCSFLF